MESDDASIRYVECLVRVCCDNRQATNLAAHFAALAARGYEPKRLIARYLANTYEDGVAWENYRGWIEV